MHIDRPRLSPVDVIDAPSEMDAGHPNGQEANKTLCEPPPLAGAAAGPLHEKCDGDCARPPSRQAEDGASTQQHAESAAGEENGGVHVAATQDDGGGDDDERWKLHQELLALRAQIVETRRQRAEVRRTFADFARRRDDLSGRRNRAERDRLDALARYRSAASDSAAASAAFESVRKLDVTNDCFHIWHRGPFGTINGLRLGSEVPPLPPSAAVVSDDELTTKVSGAEGRNGTGPAGSGTGTAYFDLSSMMFGAATSLFSDGGGGDNGAAGTPRAATCAGYDAHKVPWSETNAALGMAALLLSILQQKPNSGITFTTHELIPLGSYSKVGVVQPDGRPSSVQYNLFYADDSSFNFFGRRNFNTALDGLFRCLKDAADAAVRIDGTATLPHEVAISSRGEVTIGGLPIAFGTDNGETWTRVMKYFLSDLKWLVAFATKNIDR